MMVGEEDRWPGQEASEGIHPSHLSIQPLSATANGLPLHQETSFHFHSMIREGSDLNSYIKLFIEGKL